MYRCRSTEVAVLSLHLAAPPFMDRNYRLQYILHF
nr:MAG TPA: hypothetical protein [Caudoviricetes sp.]